MRLLIYSVTNMVKQPSHCKQTSTSFRDAPYIQPGENLDPQEEPPYPAYASIW